MEKVIKDFIKSDSTESEFFGLSKDNLIDLKEYLINLSILDEEFEKQSKSQRDSIKKKCDWVKTLYFNSLKMDSKGNNDYKMMELVAIDDVNIHAVFNKGTNQFEKNYHDLFVNRFNKSKCALICSRQEDLFLIQSELKEASEIGEEVYKDLTTTIDSVSGNFEVWTTPFDGIFVSYKDTILASFDKRRKNKNSKTYLNDKNKTKILKMIQVENTFDF